MNKNTILLIVLVVLVAIYLGNKFIGAGNERNFTEVLVALDTTSVNKIIIKAKTGGGDAVTFNNDGGQWKVTDGTITDDADENSMRGILTSMVNLKPQRLVATSDDKWAQYEVNDSLGTQVQFFNGDKALADIIIGKFSFNQAARTAATFVRLSDEKQVYSVVGFLSSTYDQTFNNFRDKTFLTTTPENLTAITLTYPGDSSFRLAKVMDNWQINGATADSVEVQTFINGLRKINQREFVDDFIADTTPTYSMTLDGNNMTSIEINGYMRDNELILNSSLNPDAYFKKGSLSVAEKLFVSPGRFVPTPE